MKNWKTLLIGAMGGALAAIHLYVQNGGNLADWKLYAIPVVIAAFGYVAKDAGVTGPDK